MENKISKSIIKGIAVVAGLSVLLAFVANISVRAQLDNSILSISSERLSFGVVFPQEKLNTTFSISFSDTFLAQLETTGEQWASSWSNYNPGPTKNGSPVPAERSDPNKALGPAQNNDTLNFVSLGFGGSLVLEFTNYIVNVTGNDIWITETTYGSPSCANYPETAKIYASQDGSNWTFLGQVCLDGSVDLGSLAWAKYLKVEDTSDPNASYPNTPNPDGYDIDGIKATSRQYLGIVDYEIKQKPKPINSADAQWCENNLPPYPYNSQDPAWQAYLTKCYPVLCYYLAKTPDNDPPPGNDGSLDAYHTLSSVVTGKIDKDTDPIDNWTLGLDTPCFKNECAQDWPHQGFEPPADFNGMTFGCDLLVEITNIR